MASPFDLTGRIALVTGAGRGIGRQIALTLAEAGADISILDLSGPEPDETVRLVGDLGRRAITVSGSVLVPSEIDAAVARTVADLGPIDILVNNAGIARNIAAEKTSDQDWLDVINVNLNGLFWCARSVGQHMLERGSGVIVNVASMSGHVVNWPQPQAAYNASKAGVIQLTRSLAAEWASRGIRVNSVSPGYIATEMTKLGMRTYPDWGEYWVEHTPMGRVGTPTDVAYAVWYLASDAASFATGTDLIVDGGYTVI